VTLSKVTQRWDSSIFLSPFLSLVLLHPPKTFSTLNFLQAPRVTLNLIFFHLPGGDDLEGPTILERFI
jgi:hypothetical protein